MLESMIKFLTTWIGKCYHCDNLGIEVHINNSIINKVVDNNNIKSKDLTTGKILFAWCHKCYRQ